MAASIQNRICALRKLSRSASALGLTLRRSLAAMSAMPGPPSRSYLAVGGRPNTWQKSSCGRRAHQALPPRPSGGMKRRSKRSTMSGRCLPKLAMCVRGTGRPYRPSRRRQSHSLSTEVLKLICRDCPPIRPSGSLNRWVVGVAPSGRHQWPSCQSRAVLSCAPAMEIRNSASSSAVAAMPPVGVTARSSACSISASSSGSASMRFTSGAAASTGSSCSAPTQSRPTSASRLKGAVSASRKREAMRRRMGSWSGSRLLK
mmetsp:Transcript_59150/g.139321  ORF Transcript_59150/g.139321 Transcript_59150/m.139321 type:complete len:259 (+) Transcript_59150:6210-6986(+)